MARYSGICWYLANSAAQSAADSGGTMPITGFHSVIDRPERVSRVMPPTTTIRKIKPQQKRSHAATGRRPASAAARGATPELATPAVEIGKDRSSKYAALDVVRASRRAPAPPHRSSERVNRLRIFGGLAGCSEPKWCYCVALGSGLVPSEKELFADLPEQPAPEAPGRGMPRLRQPERHQLGWQVATIDDLVARDHPVRAVWAFVQGLDLRALHDTVKAREGVPGQAPPAPELMMALWLWATVDGVGSARQLARLCEQHLAYRWLCGGVSMNYHSLSDFRVAHAAVLDRLLAGGVAALVAQGVVALDVLAQHGLRVSAAAGAGSFRRRERLVELAAAATARVEQLRAELDADPAA